MKVGADAREDGRVLDRFRVALGDLWPHVAPHCVDAPEDDLGRLVAQVRATSTTREPERGTEPASELEALLAGWKHYGGPERAVLRGAVAYLSEPEDAMPDAAPGSLDDDNAVVDAAIRVILRRAG